MDDSKIKNTLQSCVDEICKTAQYGYGCYSDMESLHMVFDNSVQKISKQGTGTGIILNAWNGEGFEEYATSDIRNRDLLLKKSGELGKNNTFINNGITINDISEKKIEEDFPFTGKIDPRTVPLDEKVDMIKNLQMRTRKMHSQLTNSIIRYMERKEHAIFVSPGKILQQTIFRYVFRVDFYAEGNGKTNSWMTGFNGTGGYELVKIPEDKIEYALKNVIDILSAQSLQPGTYDAIVDPETAGVIAHEAFGHGVENDVILKHRSKARDYMGMKIGSELVNMTDDPLLKGAYGFYHFDDEGQLARKTSIIENGVLKQGLGDHYSSLHLNAPDFGNGRRQTFTHKPYSRMSNTFFEPGETPLPQMIEELGDGLYVMQGTNGMEDPKNWGIQCEAKMAKEIKNGKFTGRNFTPVGISGYVPDLLQSVTAVANDFQTDFGGTCIKGYKEHVPVAVGGAFMRIRGRFS